MTDERVDLERLEVATEPSEICDNCGGTFNPDDLVFPIKDAWMRLEPGDIVPDGECPLCGALVTFEGDSAAG